MAPELNEVTVDEWRARQLGGPQGNTEMRNV
jgi:hypothetical protein